MRLSSLAFLPLALALALAPGCSDDESTNLAGFSVNENDPRAGSSGSVNFGGQGPKAGSAGASEGGKSAAGSAGSSSGGASSGSAGSSSGGASSGSGGASAGEGGSSLAGHGGASAGQGGASAGEGGSAAGGATGGGAGEGGSAAGAAGAAGEGGATGGGAGGESPGGGAGAAGQSSSGQAGAGGEGGISGSPPVGGAGGGGSGSGGSATAGQAGGGGEAGGGGVCENDDCDGDGWGVGDGDCCDRPEECPGVDPAGVNPGAFDFVGDGVDNDCDATPDASEAACDGGLPPSAGAADHAMALGVCRQTVEAPAKPHDRRWGLIDASLSRADGSPLADPGATSIRPSFGALAPAAPQGKGFVVLSTGIAADGVQTLPGPNGGAPAGLNVSSAHYPPSSVAIDKPGGPGSVHDWFQAERPPLKSSGSLPLVAGCPGKSSGTAADSVLLRLRLRAPTNARAVSFRVLFVSAEFPEFVCTSYSDQVVALIDAPGASNPPDKNLLVYPAADGTLWPLGLSLARTPLLSRCDPQAEQLGCAKPGKVSPEACSQGAGSLKGTGFEAPKGEVCTIGGATGWLTAAGNVTPGQPFDLRFALWDVGDALFDSVVLLDDLRWLQHPVEPGVGPLRRRLGGAPGEHPARLR